MRADRVIAAILRGDVATEALFGLAGDQVDRAARCIATVKRTLRSAEHLNTLHIKKFILRPDTDWRKVQEDSGSVVSGW